MARTVILLEERFGKLLLVVGNSLHRFIMRLQQGDVESSLAIDK